MIETKKWSPGWVKKEKGVKVPVFHLRPGTVLERDEFEGDLEGRHNAGGVALYVIREIAREGITALADSPDDAETMIALVEQDHDLQTKKDGAEPMDAKAKAQLREVFDILQKHWPDYRDAVAQNARHNNLLPTLAFMRWCDGWENLTDADGEPVEYSRNARGEIPDDVLRRIPALMLRAAGLEAYQVQYGRGQAKN